MLNDRFLETIQEAMSQGDFQGGIDQLILMRKSLLSHGKQLKDSEKLSQVIEQIKRVDGLIERLETLKQKPGEPIETPVTSLDSIVSTKPIHTSVYVQNNHKRIKQLLMDLLFHLHGKPKPIENVLVLLGHDDSGKSSFFNDPKYHLGIEPIILDFKLFKNNQMTHLDIKSLIETKLKQRTKRTVIIIDHLDDEDLHPYDEVLQPKILIESIMEISNSKSPLPMIVLVNNANVVWEHYFDFSEILNVMMFELPSDSDRQSYFSDLNLESDINTQLIDKTKDFTPASLLDLKEQLSLDEAAYYTFPFELTRVSSDKIHDRSKQIEEFKTIKRTSSMVPSDELSELITTIHLENNKISKDIDGTKHESWDNSLLNKEEEVFLEDILHVDHESNIRLINDVLKEYQIHFDEITFVEGLAYTRYKVRLAKGERIQKITKSYNEIKMRLRSKNVRIVAPIDQEDAIGIELPNESRRILTFQEVCEPRPILEIPVGKDINNSIVSIDFSKDPHFLIGGSTGSGKSVNLNVFIAYVLSMRRPEEVQLLLIDPKRVEFSIYVDLPHSLTSRPVNEIEEIKLAFEFLIQTMDERYKNFEMTSLRNISEYNEKNARKLPYIFAVVDEFATLSDDDEIMNQIQRLSQLARAAGIHILLATQRPSTDIVKGTIKNNFTGRIAFKVSSNHDSKTTIYESGAEDLIGKGDMLIANSGESVNRAQGAFIGLDEIKKIIRASQQKYGLQPQIKHTFKER
jgi:hypothetical protein